MTTQSNHSAGPGFPRRGHLVIGTAGHIDHGKTALVKALTGTDTDRLAEEKRRGITIELGFAFYGDRAAFVDVPGHERLVRTMVAGASAMRAALLVVAADDGVMPQTREHLAVLDALGVRRGVVAVTKADLATDDWIDLVREEVRELLAGTGLAGSPVHVVDSLSGRGIGELRASLDRMIEEAGAPEDPGFFRMPIDRSFLLRGHGRVVTGTVWSGRAVAGDRLSLLPGGETVRVRGVQAHERPVEEVGAGDRAALNLAGDVEPARGQALFSPGRGVETEFLDLKLHLLPGARLLRHRARVRLHLGTSEVIGRLLIVGGDEILPGSAGFARIALERPVAAMQGDRGVLRFYSPLETLGGVVVLDPDPPDRRRTLPGLRERLTELEGSDGERVAALVRARGWASRPDLLRLLPWAESRLDEALAAAVARGSLLSLEEGGATWVDPDLRRRWTEAAVPVLEEFHREQPEERGMTKAAWGVRVAGRELPGEVLEALLKALNARGVVRYREGFVSLPGHAAGLRRGDEEAAGRIEEVLLRAGLNAPLPATIAGETGVSEAEVRRLLRALKQVGRAVILDEKVVLAAAAYERAKEKLREAFGGEEGFTVGEAGRALGGTRKVMVPLLEQLDREGFTLREGDRRRIVG